MKKVLIIEDDNILQQAMATALKDAGFEAVQALDGEEGVKKSAEETPDLILLDLLMPKKDGWETLKEIKDNPKTKKIPIMVLTVYEGEDSISKCVEMGANGYLIKSKYSLDEIVDKVKELV